MGGGRSSHFSWVKFIDQHHATLIMPLVRSKLKKTVCFLALHNRVENFLVLDLKGAGAQKEYLLLVIF